MRSRRLRRPQPARPHGASAESSLSRLVADFGAVIGVVTALLYYFGWTRARFQARELGFDVSVLSLGTTDYLVRSLNVLFVPVLLLLLATLVLQQAHRRIVAPFVAGSRQEVVLLVARLLSLAWLPL